MNFLEEIFRKISSKNISGFTDELKVQYIDYVSRNEDKNIIVLTSSLYEATKFFNYLKTYNTDVLFFPMDDFLTSMALAVSPDLKIKRLETLNKLNDNKPKIVVCNLTGFLKYVPSIKSLKESFISLKPNNNINREELEEKLLSFGYSKTSLVTSSGEYSFRGFVLDIFPFDQSNPVRIELFGNDIEKIKFFNPESQMTFEELSEIKILPYEEIEINNKESIYSLLNDPIVFKINNDNIENAYKELLKQINDYNNSLNLDNKEYMHKLENINIKNEYKLSDLSDLNSLNFNSNDVDNFNNSLDNISFFLDHRNKESIVLFYIKSERLRKELSKIILFSHGDDFKKGNIYLISKELNKGFIFNNYIVITDTEITGEIQKSTYYNPIKIGRKIKNFNDLQLGDYVVHSAHGIGIYGGVISLKKGEYIKDYILINYAGTDKIYIPVEKINTIYRYSDKDGIKPKINKLNSISWINTKRSVKAKIKDISKELLKLYAERSSIKGPKYKLLPEDLVFASNFEFTETKDQTKCINDIYSDLKVEKPMDRLLCGDVGFGKTEVAFRAIFNTVVNGYQAVYLCPTTILAKQQYLNAVNRFNDFPVNIEIINRFTTQKEFENIVNRLKNGQIDVIFGTHKLFNKEIEYKKLGLLVIDEEQRFGVTQKEKIKELSKNVNVLTLSATPIPRTLKMAMSGIKDLSILDTAPVDRYPVQTYVIKYNDLLIKDIIYKELSRNGQVYYLFNNVNGIEREVEKLKLLVPEAKICYAHGQMSKQELENIFEDFVNEKYNVIVCTTIIETGIDIPNVNTLIVKDAENFGLSQLYQLRGRVGRSNKIAYAYLTYNNDKILSDVATKRLNAIKEFTELGSGYKIAMRDLSIRGAGDLLGSEQAGFIDSVGIELYTKMVEEALNELNGNLSESEDEDMSSLIDVDTHIDTEYVSDETIRIEIHKLINTIDSYKTLLSVKEEIEDRFGKIDDKLEIYMYEEWFEKLAYKLGIKNISQFSDRIEFALPEEVSSKLNAEKLFLKLYNINPKFKIKYIAKRIIITLPIINLDKHYIYYLTSILEEIINDTE